MKTEYGAFVLLFTIVLIQCCLPVYSQGDIQDNIDTSGEKIESREVKCLGEKLVFVFFFFVKNSFFALNEVSST